PRLSRELEPMIDARRVVVVASVAVLLAGVGASSADEASEKHARELFVQGNALVEKGSYVEALEKFRAAYGEWRNPKILLNIATTLRQLGRNAEAGDAYDQWLADPGADPKRRPEVMKALQEIDALVGHLVIHVAHAGVRVVVDGRVLGEIASSVSVRVDPGVHGVVGDCEGCAEMSATVVVAKGETRSLELGAPTDVKPPPTP